MSIESVISSIVLIIVSWITIHDLNVKMALTTILTFLLTKLTMMDNLKFFSKNEVKIFKFIKVNEKNVINIIYQTFENHLIKNCQIKKNIVKHEFSNQVIFECTENQSFYIDNYLIKVEKDHFIISSKKHSMKQIEDYIVNIYEKEHVKKSEIKIVEYEYSYSYENKIISEYYLAIEYYLIENFSNQLKIGIINSTNNKKKYICVGQNIQDKDVNFLIANKPKENLISAKSSESSTSFIISSEVLSCDQLNDFIEEKYQNYLDKKPKSIKIYNLIISKNISSNLEISFKVSKNIYFKNLTNTFYSDYIEKEFISDFDHFMKNKDEIKRKNLSYKRGYILESVAGMGKTTLVKILALKYSLKIFNLDLTMIVDNQMLKNYFDLISSSIEEGEPYIILMEDIERSSYFNPQLLNEKLSKDKLIDMIDGVESSEGRILIMTSNDSSIILKDKALTRKGRIDKIVKFSFIEETQMSKIFEFYYKEKLPSLELKDNLTPAILEDFLFSCETKEQFIEFISN